MCAWRIDPLPFATEGELALQAFIRVLDEPELAGIDAGIVLQADVPRP